MASKESAKPTDSTSTNGSSNNTSKTKTETAQEASIKSTGTQTTSAVKSTLTTPEVVKYEDFQIMPDSVWPTPIFIRKNIPPQERYYIQHRWNSQWSFFDKKATDNKKMYLRLQWIVGVGSVTVPVLVGIRDSNDTIQNGLYIATVIISLAVAIATAIENINSYGENWRSYRQAAEELHQEKALYDVHAGRYANNPEGFIRFVERCEEIIAQQNGRFIQSLEKSQTQAEQQTQESVETYVDEEAGIEITSQTTTDTTFAG